MDVRLQWIRNVIKGSKSSEQINYGLRKAHLSFDFWVSRLSSSAGAKMIQVLHAKYFWWQIGLLMLERSSRPEGRLEQHDLNVTTEELNWLWPRLCKNKCRYSFTFLLDDKWKMWWGDFTPPALSRWAGWTKQRDHERLHLHLKMTPSMRLWTWEVCTEISSSKIGETPATFNFIRHYKTQ